MTVTSVATSLNPIDGLRELWSYPFMVNAFRAGSLIAVTAGAIGWFMVLRRQTFAGHTLSVAAFPGAAGATLIGLPALLGYFGFAVVAALAIAAAPGMTSHGHGGEESAVIGTVQAVALASGFLFVSLYHGFLTGLNSLLFGSFLGISDGQVAALLVVSALALAVLAVIARPLLFASLDPAVAAARGVRTRLLGVVFLLLLGLAAAEASQITGSLLVFALLVMPAATAQRLTARPMRGLVLSVAIGLVVTWAGLTVAYYTDYPVGFYITTFAFGLYCAVSVGSLAGNRRMRSA